MRDFPPNYGLQVTLQELLDLRQPGLSLDLTQQRNIRSQLIGGHLSQMRGRGMEFSEVRGYQAGDDIRHMEWRGTARTGKPQIKLYREERERPIFLVVDFNSSMFFGTRVAFKSVIAARLAALIAWSSFKQGDRVGGLLFSAEQHLEFKPLARRQGILPLLKGLSDFSQQSPTNNTSHSLSDACLKLHRVSKPGAMTIIISDFSSMDERTSSQLRRLAQQQQVIACYIRDPIEILPPPPQKYSITDGVHCSELDTRSLLLREQYQQHFATIYQSRKKTLQQLNIPILDIMTTDNLLLKLQQFFHLQNAGISYAVNQ